MLDGSLQLLCSLPVLLLLLFPAPARAAGLVGGLAGLQIIAIGLLVLFTGVAVVAWYIIRSVAKSQRESAAKESGAPAVRPPTGLRILIAVQYPLAFIYGFVGFVQLKLPHEFHDGHVAHWLIQASLFRISFAVLALLSASGYSNASLNWGFRLGMALGWMCVGNFLLVLFLHGTPSLSLVYIGLDPVSLLFGVTLLGLLHWRYRPYFGVEEPSPVFARLSSGLLLGVKVLIAVVVLVPVTSLIVTTVLPQHPSDASRFLRDIAKRMYAYREEHGDFPAVLEDLDPPVDRYYRWHRVQYLPEKMQLKMRLGIPREQDLRSRMTFHMIGGRDRTAAVIRQLREETPQGALD